VPAEVGDESKQASCRSGGQGEIGGEKLSRLLAEPGALAPLGGEHVDHVDLGGGEARQIIGAQLAPVVLIQALLGNVRSHERRELRLLEAEPLPFLRKPSAETHRF
jgi:hypothetical protein